MSAPKTYWTAGALRKAPEERLRKTSQTDQIDINRLRRQLSFDRLPARLFHGEADPWILKGGWLPIVDSNRDSRCPEGWHAERISICWPE